MRTTAIDTIGVIVLVILILLWLCTEAVLRSKDWIWTQFLRFWIFFGLPNI